MLDRRSTLLCLLLLPLLLVSAAKAPPGPGTNAHRWTIDAVSTDPDKAARPREELRPLGPAGLEAFLFAHADELTGAATPARRREALDQVAGQYDANSARLYWYTDLDAAKKAAAEFDRPILSLRLLGRLDED